MTYFVTVTVIFCSVFSFLCLDPICLLFVIFQLMAPTVTFKNVEMQFIISKRKHSTDEKDDLNLFMFFFSFVLLRGWIVLEWKRTYLGNSLIYTFYCSHTKIVWMVSLIWQEKSSARFETSWSNPQVNKYPTWEMRSLKITFTSWNGSIFIGDKFQRIFFLLSFW